MKYQAEVGLLSHEVMFQPLSDLLPVGIRFLRHPLPAPPTVRLAIHLPRRAEIRVYRVSLKQRGGLGPAYSPVAPDPCASKVEGRHPRYVPFWLKPISAFGLFRLTTFISSSLLLTNTTKPCTQTALTLAVCVTLSRPLHTHSLPSTHGPVGYR